MQPKKEPHRAIREPNAAACAGRGGRVDLFGDSASTIIGRMQARMVELGRHTKEIKRGAAEIQQRAKRIRLAPIRGVIDATTVTARSLRDARDAREVSEADQAAVRSKIDSVIMSLEAPDKAVREVRVLEASSAGSRRLPVGARSAKHVRRLRSPDSLSDLQRPRRSR